VLTGQKSATFAISRWLALAGWEVQPPLRLERPADACGTAGEERIPDTLEGPQRLTIDALGGHNNEPPANLVQFLSPEDVGQPLGCIYSMISRNSS
jgi:hypothetical protein